jgi:dihydroorotase
MKQSILIQNAIILDSQSEWNGKKVDIFVVDGLISSIGDRLSVVADLVYDAKNSTITQGWLDLYGFCPDPGEEFKESLSSYSIAAQQGGFTHAVALCGSHPQPETGSAVRSIIERQQYQNWLNAHPGQNAHPPKEKFHCEIIPLGLASEDGKGAELSDMSELLDAGAVALTDGITGGMSTAYLSKAFEYAKMLNATIMVHPFDRKMVKGAEIHEGMVSVNLGMKGIPVAAETSALFSIIEISEWLDTPVVIQGISCARSVQIIQDAKKRGVKIKAIVPVMNLQFNHEILNEFDETFKVLPPLRTEEDRLALVEGLMNGVIDGVFSNHTPEDVENKKLEFAYAHFGAATLPAFAHLALNGLNSQQQLIMIEVLTRRNREILGWECNKFEVGERADFTLFSQTSNVLKSKSLAYNTVLKNSECSVSVNATVFNGQLIVNN